MSATISNNSPVKRIAGDDEIAAWTRSLAYARVTGHIAALSEAIAGLKLPVEVREDAAVTTILDILETVERWIQEIPLRQDPQRFGNLAFREWGRRLTDKVGHLHQEFPTRENPEIIHHFTTAFGSFTRIDYGTGHELSFIAYLCVLTRLGILGSNTLKAQACVIFPRYMQVCHRIQKVYRLEPAGSKGVWGLDDYHFLPYLFGASQYAGSTSNDLPLITSIQHPITLDHHLARENLFYRSLAQIHDIKRGPFHEHSPVLYNIASTVPNWQKVFSGLNKMYAKEVLEKWPVVQHFYFGHILSWTDARTGAVLSSSINDTPTNTGSNSANATDERKEALAAINAAWSSDPTTSGTAAPWAKTTARPVL